jgi:hypothetical protein
MKHVNEEQLILYYYAEAESAEEVDRHLAECESCRSEYQGLQRVLNTVDSLPVPERAENYESVVWRHLQPRLGARSRWDWSALLRPRSWAIAGAMAALLVVAYLAGRGTREQPPQVATVTKSPAGGQVRERVLLVAVGEHLERSQMVLVELSNASAKAGSQGSLDISYEQRAAEDLLESNRLFRQTANSTGNARTADLLDDLERVLIEIAHSPSKVSAGELENIKREIEDRGILFKVKVFGSQLAGERRTGTL